MVVPAVLVATITAQYNGGIYLLTVSCEITVIKKKLKKIRVLTPYPTFRVCARRSPPVSPKVVAVIFVIQNNKVSSGILLRYLLSSPALSILFLNGLLQR